jgi:hypothetical protein
VFAAALLLLAALENIAERERAAEGALGAPPSRYLLAPR